MNATSHFCQIKRRLQDLIFNFIKIFMQACEEIPGQWRHICGRANRWKRQIHSSHHITQCENNWPSYARGGEMKIYYYINQPSIQISWDWWKGKTDVGILLLLWGSTDLIYEGGGIHLHWPWEKPRITVKVDVNVQTVPGLCQCSCAYVQSTGWQILHAVV